MENKENCQKWALAEATKCAEFAQCKVAEHKDVSKCLGTYNAMIAATVNDDVEASSETTQESVGECYTNSL